MRRLAWAVLSLAMLCGSAARGQEAPCSMEPRWIAVTVVAWESLRVQDRPAYLVNEVNLIDLCRLDTTLLNPVAETDSRDQRRAGEDAKAVIYLRASTPAGDRFYAYYVRETAQQICEAMGECEVVSEQDVEGR